MVRAAALERIVDSLFRTTPPTALFVGDRSLFHSTQLQLAAKGILAPRDVSLFCSDFEESFLWTRPEISHIRWDHRPAVRRAVRWANNIARGQEDTGKTLINARLHEGGTMGPVRSGEVSGSRPDPEVRAKREVSESHGTSSTPHLEESGLFVSVAPDKMQGALLPVTSHRPSCGTACSRGMRSMRRRNEKWSW